MLAGMVDYPPIPYGLADFRSIRREGYLYVDKTRFLRELERTRFTVFIRPRRFGKSCWISVLEHYYDRRFAGEFDALFGGLHIGENPTPERNSHVTLRFNFSAFRRSLDGLEENFNLHVVVLLPIFALLTMMIMKISAIPAMIAATFLATLVSLAFQGSNLPSALNAINNGYTDETGFALVDSILVRGGIQSMMWTFSLAYLALCLGGVLEKVGYLTVLVEKIVDRIRAAANLVTLVIGTTFLANIAMGTNYMSIILNGNIYRPVFKKAGIRRRMLSRLLEEGGTQTAALVPWSTAGAFMAGTLGVATFTYLPYAFLNYINPLLSIMLAYLGFFIFMAPKESRQGD